MVKRVYWVAMATGGLMAVAAGCGAAADVVVLAPAPGAAGSTITTPTKPSVVPKKAVTPSTTKPTIAPTTTPPTTVALVPALPTGPKPVPVPALETPLAPARQGQTNPAVKAIEDRLLQLGFWVDAADGKYTFVTSQAVMAFQKDEGLPRTGVADAATVDRMTKATQRVMARAFTGDLVEVDKGRQLLFIVRRGQAVWAVNTSTASGQFYAATGKNSGMLYREHAVTPAGTYQVDRQRPNGWWEGDLGRIYRPKYFDGGRAIHGMTNIPGYPASHGCVRVSTPFMDYVWDQNLLPLGGTVWVHEGKGENMPLFPMLPSSSTPPPAT
jgi:peptidoglycan hydrolase-like protein with peptidoglycan-binding domain